MRMFESISHPNVVEFKESFWDEKQISIIMEYLDNDLESKIIKMRKENLRFDESIIWSYSIQMMEALKAFHDKEIILDYIECSNIFLLKDKNTCKISIMNLRNIDPYLYKYQHEIFGIYYYSPEIFEEDLENNSYKTNIWNIGCIVYELCTLRPPFQGRNFIELIKKIREGNIERIEHCYSDELWKMILMLLERDITKRVNCNEFLNSELIKKKIKEMKKMEENNF